jgi:hypothetical protein
MSSLPDRRKVPEDPSDDGRSRRSMRRSEWDAAGPRDRPEGGARVSQLPLRRHSADEISRMRRDEALARFEPGSEASHTRFRRSHPALVVFGYLGALGETSSFFVKNFTIEILAGTFGLAALVALLVFWRYPLSRHHSAFIAILALTILVFAVLHHFPELTNAA